MLRHSRFNGSPGNKLLPLTKFCNLICKKRQNWKRSRVSCVLLWSFQYGLLSPPTTMISEPCPFSATCYVCFGINESRILKDGKRGGFGIGKRKWWGFGKNTCLELSQLFPKRWCWQLLILNQWLSASRKPQDRLLPFTHQPCLSCSFLGSSLSDCFASQLHIGLSGCLFLHFSSLWYFWSDWCWAYSSLPSF